MLPNLFFMIRSFFAIAFFILLSSCKQDDEKATLMYNMAMLNDRKGPVKSVTKKHYSDCDYVFDEWKPTDDASYWSSTEHYDENGLLIHYSSMTAAKGYDTTFLNSDFSYSFNDTLVIAKEIDHAHNTTFTWYYKRLNDSSWRLKKIDTSGITMYEGRLVFTENNYLVKAEYLRSGYVAQTATVYLIDHTTEQYVYDIDMNLTKAFYASLKHNDSSEVEYLLFELDKYSNPASYVGYNKNSDGTEGTSIAYLTYEYYR